MVSKINILGYRIEFVLRHRFEKNLDFTDKYLYWKDYKLGIWLKRYKTVSKPKNGPAVIGKDGTLSNNYMLGIDFIFCKFWIDICYRPLILNFYEKDR